MTQPAKEFKIDIDDGKVFFADEIGVMHNPLKFFLDFKNITPRVDVRSSEYQQLVLKHNVIVLDPYLVKEFVRVANESLKKYEEKFGKIEIPHALEKAKEIAPKEQQAKAETNHDINKPTYFG